MTVLDLPISEQKELATQEGFASLEDWQAKMQQFFKDTDDFLNNLENLEVKDDEMGKYERFFQPISAMAE